MRAKSDHDEGFFVVQMENGNLRGKTSEEGRRRGLQIRKFERELGETGTLAAGGKRPFGVSSPHNLKNSHQTAKMRQMSAVATAFAERTEDDNFSTITSCIYKL